MLLIFLCYLGISTIDFIHKANFHVQFLGRLSIQWKVVIICKFSSLALKIGLFLSFLQPQIKLSRSHFFTMYALIGISFSGREQNVEFKFRVSTCKPHRVNPAKSSFHSRELIGISKISRCDGAQITIIPSHETWCMREYNCRPGLSTRELRWQISA